LDQCQLGHDKAWWPSGVGIWTNAGWGVIKRGGPQVSVFGPVPVVLCVSGLPNITSDTVTNGKSRIVPFAVDTSITVTNRDIVNFIRISVQCLRM
jgi:hypothetical protein